MNMKTKRQKTEKENPSHPTDQDKKKEETHSSHQNEIHAYLTENNNG